MSSYLQPAERDAVPSRANSLRDSLMHSAARLESVQERLQRLHGKLYGPKPESLKNGNLTTPAVQPSIESLALQIQKEIDNLFATLDTID